MKQVRRFWRTLLSLTILTALCGSFAFPVVNVRAAPGQGPLVCNVPFATWTFDNLSTGPNSSPLYSFKASDVTAATSSLGALSSPTISATSPHSPPNDWYASGFATGAAPLNINNNDYFEFVIDTTNYSGVNLNFYAFRTSSGPTTLQMYYSIDGSTFNPLAGTYSVGTAYPATALTADLNGITNTAGNTYIRVYGWNAQTAGGNLHIDDITFTGCQPATPTPTATDTGTPTPTATVTNTPTSTPTATATATPSPVRSVIINEVAWGGTLASSTDEWFELYNTTGADINLNGWHLTADDGNPDIALSGTITAADPYFVFARSAQVFSDLTPDKTYSGSLSNNGEILYLIDPNGKQVDSANADGGMWNAGLGSPTYASMERQGNVPDSPTAWATYAGTVPVAHDSAGNPIKGTPGQKNSILTITPTPTPTITPTGTPTGSLHVLINEVAWSGTAANSSDEWIELFNPTASPVDFTGWQLYGDDNVFNKVGSPKINLTGTIPANGYFLLERDEAATDVKADQIYSGDLVNSGERLYLKDQSGKTVDIANSDGGPWPAGTSASTSASTLSYASMERVGTSGSQWATYGGTIPVAHDRNGNGIKGTPGKPNWISTSTITTISSDTPDPSVVNQYVSVFVTVIGGLTTPTGTVSVTGANTNCTISLSNGVGSCLIRFTTTGSKTITATYSGDNRHPASVATASHQVYTSGSFFPTPTPFVAPPPPLLAINEFVPRPGHDWNHDGVVNVGDEYIEILNHGTVDVNLSGYRLDDEVNVGSNPYSLPAKVLKPGERIVFFGSETGLLLGDGGDAVRLLKPNGQLMDAYNYTVVRYPDESFCRLPDNGGADDWNQYCYPTPGLQNSLSGNFPVPSGSIGQESQCPIADTLPSDFVLAECDPFGNNIWRPQFWDRTGWYDEKYLPQLDSKWPTFAD